MTSDDNLLSKKARRDAAIKRMESALTRNDLINAAVEAIDAAPASTYIDVDQDIVDGLLSEVVGIVVDAVLRAQAD